MKLTITSPAFEDGKRIPVKFTCQGDDVSPPLKWSAAEVGAKSYALICDDPDAPGGTWVHWVIYNIPASARGLGEHVPSKDMLPDGSLQGVNDFKRVGYGGPCPPPGRPHRYSFRLYALDMVLSLKPRASKAELLRAMESHVLAEAQHMGTFQRP